MENKKQVIKRKFTGTVVTVGGAKTVGVSVVSNKVHPKYKKQYKTTKKYSIHDEKGLAKVGDEVRFIECRPLSKSKRWRLLEVLSK